MWRFKYLLIGMIFPALLGIGVYIAAPRFVDWVQDQIGEAAADEVQQSFQREVPGTVEPGQIVITERQLLRALLRADENESSFNASDYEVDIDDGQIRITDSDRDPNASDFNIATVAPVVEGDRLILSDRGGAIGIFKTARDAIGDEIEAQAAAIFERSGVRPVSVTAENGRLVVVTEAIDGRATTPEPVAGATEIAAPTATTRSILNPLRRTPTATP